MPKTYKPRAKMSQALTDVAKAVNYVKAMHKETEREEKVTETLPKLRELWKAARDGQDPVMLSRFVTMFNAHKYLYGVEIICNRQYTEDGYAYVVTRRQYH